MERLRARRGRKRMKQTGKRMRDGSIYAEKMEKVRPAPKSPERRNPHAKSPLEKALEA